jgi:hypothetical protein
MFRYCQIIIRELCSLLKLRYSIHSSTGICKRGVVAAIDKNVMNCMITNCMNCMITNCMNCMITNCMITNCMNCMITNCMNCMITNISLIYSLLMLSHVLFLFLYPVLRYFNFRHFYII